MKASELIKKLESAGWYEDRQQGSHRVFKHPNEKDHISVPDHGKRDLGRGLLSAILKKAGLK